MTLFTKSSVLCTFSNCHISVILTFIYTNCTKTFYAKPCHTPRLIILQIQHTFLNLFCSRGVFSVRSLYFHRMSACQLRTVHADKHICVCVSICGRVLFSSSSLFLSLLFVILSSPLYFQMFSHTLHFHYFMLTCYDYMHMNSFHIRIHWPTYFEREYEHAIQIRCFAIR